MRSITKRLRWLVALALVGLLGLYPLLAPTPHRINQAHADLITQGMTKDQVEAIFGVPAGQYDWAEEGGHERFFLAYLRLIEVEASHRIKLAAKPRKALVAQDDSDDEVVIGALREFRVPFQTSLTWTSRHGSFMFWFDENECVVSANSWTEVRTVPPWQRWWKTIWKK